MKSHIFLSLTFSFLVASSALTAGVKGEENQLVPEPVAAIDSALRAELVGEGREIVGKYAEQIDERDAQKQKIQNEITTAFQRFKDSKGRAPHPAGIRASIKAAKYPLHPDTITYFADVKKKDNAFWESPTVTLELEDTSLWRVKPFYGAELNGWKKTDQIVVTESNKLGFNDDYEYRILNQCTGGSVPVNLVGAPVNPKRIERIYRVNPALGNNYDMVFLNDGRQMEVSSYDLPVTSQWSVDDVIIVGIHGGSLRGGYPNLLINATRLTSARAAYVIYR